MSLEFVFLPPSEADQPYSVSEINYGIASTIESSNTLVWVTGEISNWKRASSGHCYLRLKDEQSQIPAVIWRDSAQKLDFKPEDGTAVLVIGSIKVYQRGGYYQLTIHKMAPAGKGTLFQAFEQLKERLAIEGLFDQERKKTLPKSVRTLGVITSKRGAAVKDIVRVTATRAPQTDIVLIDVAVQGEKAPGEIAQAIKDMNSYAEVDCIIAGRGGGSIEDLWAFNDESVARAIFESKIPVISAVGHETDFTIADFVADYRAATPSAAAEFAVADSKENRRYFEACSQRFINGFINGYSSMIQTYHHLQSSRSFQKPLRLLQEAAQDYDRSQERCYRALHGSMRSMVERLGYAGARLETLSPLSVLKRGYSVTTDKNGITVRSCRELSTGDVVSIRFSDGSAGARIEGVEGRCSE